MLFCDQKYRILSILSGDDWMKKNILGIATSETLKRFWHNFCNFYILSRLPVSKQWYRRFCSAMANTEKTAITKMGLGGL